MWELLIPYTEVTIVLCIFYSIQKENIYTRKVLCISTNNPINNSKYLSLVQSCRF